MPKHIGRRSLRILGMLSLAACSAQGDGVSGPRVEAGDASWVQAGSADAGDRIAAPDGGFIAPIGGDSAVGPPGVVVTDSGSRPAQGPNVCASVRVAANRITPRVMLLIDGSGSMAEPLGDVSRWGALRTALLGPAGVVRELEGIVEFGMTVYSTPIPMRGAPLGMCPSLLSVPPALNNLESIAATFPQRPSGGFTPTGEALQGVVDALSAPSAAPSRGETLIVLATDGEPNGCDALQTLPLQALLDGLVPVNYGPSETAVSAAQSKNIDTYVVSLAPELIRKAQSRQHLQTLANLGQGLDRAASAGAEVFSPQDPAQLEMTLRSLVGSVVTCELGLEGKLVIDQACNGDVRLNGTPLACNGEHGWAVVDASTIRLQGDACTTWKQEAKAAVEAVSRARSSPCSETLRRRRCACCRRQWPAGHLRDRLAANWRACWGALYA